MERAYLSGIMLQLKPGALTQTPIDQDSSGQYLPASFQTGTRAKYKVFNKLSRNLFY